MLENGGDDSDEDEETQQVEEKPMEVVKEPEETWTNFTIKTDEPTEEQIAATKIQAAQRGKAARKEMQAREEAATKIQAVQRWKDGTRVHEARRCRRKWWLGLKRRR